MPEERIIEVTREGATDSFAEWLQTAPVEEAEEPQETEPEAEEPQEPLVLTPGMCSCSSCTGRREYVWACPDCRTWHSTEEEAADCCYEPVEEQEYFYCGNCGEPWSTESAADSCCFEEEEDYGSASLPVIAREDVYRVSVPALSGRRLRLCSIEQELTAGARRAAETLCEIGISPYSEIVSYSQSGSAGGAVVKEDGSLPESGGEVVYSRFSLWSERDATEFSYALARIRQLADNGLVKCGAAAGTHIHISAKSSDGSCFMPEHITALHELFTHLQDTLYALAACGWKEHRCRYGDEGYCKTLPEPWEGKKSGVVRAMRQDRYFGLNFQRLFSAVQACSCGAAIVGAWDECDCGAMDSATVEWRLWNSSTKPETIHAWLLLSHALTALATSHTIGTLEPTEIRTGTPQSRWSQLEWLLSHAPLSAEEQEVIRSAAHRSPGFIEGTDY